MANHFMLPLVYSTQISSTSKMPLAFLISTILIYLRRGVLYTPELCFKHEFEPPWTCKVQQTNQTSFNCIENEEVMRNSCPASVSGLGWVTLDYLQVDCKRFRGRGLSIRVRVLIQKENKKYT